MDGHGWNKWVFLKYVLNAIYIDQKDKAVGKCIWHLKRTSRKPTYSPQPKLSHLDTIFPALNTTTSKSQERLVQKPQRKVVALAANSLPRHGFDAVA